MGALSTINGILSAVETTANIASTVNSLSSSGLLKGINLNNITPQNISGVGTTLMSNITGQSDSIMKEVESSMIDVSEIERVAETITPEDVGIDTSSVFDELKSIPGFDPSMLEGIDFK